MNRLDNATFTCVTSNISEARVVEWALTGSTSHNLTDLESGLTASVDGIDLTNSVAWSAYTQTDEIEINSTMIGELDAGDYNISCYPELDESYVTDYTIEVLEPSSSMDPAAAITISKIDDFSFNCSFDGLLKTETIDWTSGIIGGTQTASGSGFTISQGSEADEQQHSTLDIEPSVVKAYSSGSDTVSCYINGDTTGSTVDVTVLTPVVTVSESAKTIDTLSGDSITFTCMITGITRNVTVEWDGVDQLSSEIIGLNATDGEFTVDQGSYSDNTQNSTLIVSGVGLANLTSGYFGVECSISEDVSYTDSSSNITLYVSSIEATTATVPTGNIYTGVTLTCKLSDIVSDFDISFESASFENMTSPITATNGSIVVTQGAYNSTDLTKEAEVVIGAESIEGLAEGNYTVTCFVDYLNDTQEMEVIIRQLVF
eukprot:sb/3464911/